jgi:hypothetical protein
MRWRAVALVSIAANIGLAMAWLTPSHPRASRAAAAAPKESPDTSPPRTNVVVRREFFTWQEVESTDYPTYIANLRDIGCPEQTIRDIIIADVNALYAKRRAAELVTPEQQWWRSDADPAVVQAAAEKARALEEERTALLGRLLGSAWEAGDLVSMPRPVRPSIVLDGPVLGELPAETKLALQEVSYRSEDRLLAYLEALRREGKEPDPAQLFKLRQQTREELARLLSPPQLEEFLLRYSQDANNLRAEFGQLAYFNPTPDEFRAVFRAVDPIDQQLQAMTGTDVNTTQGRKALERQRETYLKNALGAKRYEEYRRLHDPVYREAMATAIQAGTPEAVETIYEITLAAGAKQADISADASLTPEQKAIEQKRLELEQFQANTLAAGQQLPPEPAATTPTRRITYTLQQGDTAAVVCLIYGVPMNALRAANPRLNLNKLHPGDTVVVPRNPLAPLPAP